MIRIERFSDSLSKDWDDLLDRSRNGTFLLKRGFISYHLHLFNEVSLIVYINDEAVAVLPLNEKHNTVYSYGGLTYGGMIYKDEIRLTQIIDIWNACIKELIHSGYTKAIFKLVPDHYTKIPSEESKYALFLNGAQIKRVDTALVVDRKNLRPYQKRRLRSIKKATKSGYRLVFDDRLDMYWNNILTPNLLQKHGVKPVHSLEEISLLKERFPDNIKQVNVYHNDRLVAGTTLFLTDLVAHAQYISGSELGRNGGFLDLMFKVLIESDFLSQKYFDFGIANEQEGKALNMGLTEWKESFGATTSCHFFYELTLI